MELTVAAGVMPSLAMDPGKATIPGFQAFCLEHPEGDLLFVNGDWMENVWIGAWHQNWIDARLDAVAHNMIKHPWSQAPLPVNWWDF